MGSEMCIRDRHWVVRCSERLQPPLEASPTHATSGSYGKFSLTTQPVAEVEGGTSTRPLNLPACITSHCVTHAHNVDHAALLLHVKLTELDTQHCSLALLRLPGPLGNRDCFGLTAASLRAATAARTSSVTKLIISARLGGGRHCLRQLCSRECIAQAPVSRIKFTKRHLATVLARQVSAEPIGSYTERIAKADFSAIEAICDQPHEHKAHIQVLLFPLGSLGRQQLSTIFLLGESR